MYEFDGTFSASKGVHRELPQALTFCSPFRSPFTLRRLGKILIPFLIGVGAMIRIFYKVVMVSDGLTYE